MRLRLYGGGDATPWKRLAEQEGCGDSVEFAGPTDDLPARFLENGFLVLPSRVEGLSNVLLEAQAAGLPAVVSDIGGNVAVVRHGETGLVVPVDDPVALAEAMVRMHRSAEWRGNMGRAARQRIEAEFAIDRIAERLEAVYRRVLQERAPASK